MNGQFVIRSTKKEERYAIFSKTLLITCPLKQQDLVTPVIGPNNS